MTDLGLIVLLCWQRACGENVMVREPVEFWGKVSEKNSHAVILCKLSRNFASAMPPIEIRWLGAMAR